MPYLTQQQISDAFGQQELVDLADRDHDGSADPEVVDQAIDRADGLIDSYLRSRFDLPLPETPKMVRECALALVRYYLSEDHQTDRVKDDYDRALGWLKEIRDGKMDIGLTPSGGDVAATSGGPQSSGGRDVFDADALDAFTYDTGHHDHRYRR